MFEKITERYKAGYPGKDSMRAKAERLFGSELASTPMDMPASFSAPDPTKMRLFKKGGHVKRGGKVIEGGSLTDLHLPRHRSTHRETEPHNEMSERHEHARKMNRGGRCYAEGGAVMKSPHATSYEHHMVGEHAGRKSRINYEADMKGEKVIQRAKKEGGHIQKFAAGGVAKIRHKVATPEGKPIMKKVKKGCSC